jgi:hypothetical protein
VLQQEHDGKMKHLSLQLFWLRDVVQEGLIAPTFVATQNMAADIFTKALDQFEVQKCVAAMSLVCQCDAPYGISRVWA